MHDAVDEYKSSILKENMVYLLSTLKNCFVELMNERNIDISENYQAERFEKQLSDICPELAFIAQTGQSDLVCSGSITVN